jgi:hypothetical protein
MFLETMPTFQKHWQDQGGLPAFQERVHSMLNLPEYQMSIILADWRQLF